MNKRDLLDQLDGVIDNANDMLKDPLSDEIWKKDIECAEFCKKLVEEFVDDNGNIIYDKKTFDTKDEAKTFKEKCGDKYRSMIHVTCGDKEWWTVEYKF